MTTDQAYKRIFFVARCVPMKTLAVPLMEPGRKVFGPNNNILYDPLAQLSSDEVFTTKVYNLIRDTFAPTTSGRFDFFEYTRLVDKTSLQALKAKLSDIKASIDAAYSDFSSRWPTDFGDDPLPGGISELATGRSDFVQWIIDAVNQLITDMP